MAKRILIIEDDVFLGDILRQKLSSSGYDVAVSHDGGEGFKALTESKPDLLLLDIGLPTMTGFQILEEKMKDEALRRIPAIVISNSGEPVEIDKILALNVKDYFIKAQFDPDEVVQKVRLQLRESNSTPVAVSTSAAPGIENKGSVVSSLKNHKIMWVEDDIFLSDIIARKLAGEGCKLVHASNGNDVLPIVEKELPDAILLDILLPGMDGFEILRLLKENPKLKSIPVILLSNLGQKSDIEKGEKLGAYCFLVKATVTLDEIVDEVKKVVGI